VRRYGTALDIRQDQLKRYDDGVAPHAKLRWCPTWRDNAAAVPFWVIGVTNEIVMRPATAEDKRFVDDLLVTTMRDYVETTWPNDISAQDHYYEINGFDPSNTRILQLDGKDVGRLSTTVRADCIFIDELHILPRYQRQGIGKQAIDQVFKEAREKGLPVRATVLKVNNPSQKLLQSVGFEVVAEKDHRLYIEYPLEG